MSHRQSQSQQPYEPSERTAVLERDIYHMDARLNDLSDTVDSAHARLHALSERIRRAEYQLDSTTSSLISLQKHTTNIAEKMPDIEGMIKVLRWMMEAIKYIAGMAIIAGALAGGQTMEALKAVFG